MPLLSEHPFVPPCGITAEVLPGGECRRGGGKSSELRGKSKRCAFLKGRGIETLRVSQGAMARYSVSLQSVWVRENCHRRN